jgi:hypothetical protein
LRAKKSQPVEVKTLVQIEIDLSGARIISDIELAQHLNDGWSILNMTIAPDNGERSAVRYVTLSRPVKPADDGGKRKAAAAQPVPVTTAIIGEGVIPVTPQEPVVIGGMYTLNGKPMNFQQAMQLVTDGTLSVEDALAIGDQQALNAGRAAIQARKPYQPAYRSFPLLGGK